MKKLGGKSFWIILIISIVSLIILTLGVILLTRENSKEFYSAGYIISSSATKSDKLYFKDKTIYKENVFDEYVFKDVDNKEVSTNKNNFIHYLDNSLSFMKNGVILDLDNINTSLVPYYNITDKSIIKYNNGGYYIENEDKTLIFGNFLGKITDNKYIVVGTNIRVQLAGSNESISGNYFEILFTEEGVVKIENAEGSYQTASEGSIIYVGDKIKINLGEKNVYLDDSSRLSLNEMTIDGNENIDIKPSDGKVKNNEKGNDKPDDGNGTGQGGQTGQDTPTTPTTPSGDDSQSGTTKEPTSVVKKEVSVDLVAAKAGINSIEASFQIIDTADFIKGNLILTLVNTDTGKTVYQKTLVNASDIQSVNIESLSPDSNYVMTISEENNETGIEYFKKIFKTDTLDISLVREYVTQNSLSYSIDFGTSNVKSLNISIYDKENKQVGETHTIYNSTDNLILFEGLEKNTTYNIKVDSVVFNNLNYSDVYTINTSDITLKQKPELGEISVKVKDDGKEFSLLMEEAKDEDKSITKYIYEIYKAEDITEEGIQNSPAYTFTANKLEEQKLKLGENNILSNIDYRFRVVVEYYDNYKYNQIETSFSNYFQVLGKPTITFELNEEETSFNVIVGTVKINDEGCTVPNTGRTCFDQKNNFSIKYYGKDKIKKDIQGVTFSSDTMTYEMTLRGLLEDTTYTFEVYADVDMQNGLGLQERMYIGEFTAKTKGTKALKMQNWKDNNYTYEDPISVSTELISTDPTDTSVDKITSITFNIYGGNVKNSILPEPLGTFTTEGNIKEYYYNKEFELKSSMFGIENLDALRELSGGKLLKEYTIEVTDAYDETKTNKFEIQNNMYVFKTPSILLLEDEVSTPEILVDEITNKMTASGEYSIKEDQNLDDDTIRGYKVTAIYDKDKINSVLKTVDNPIRAIEFYVYDRDGKIIDTKTVSAVGNNNNEVYFFLENGTPDEVEDKEMRRGNSYKFSYILKIDTNNDGKEDDTYPSNKPTSKIYNAVKKSPSFRMYVSNSTKNTITYKYSVVDIDNALVKNTEQDKYLLYYSINEEEYNAPIEITNEFKEVTLNNLNNSDIYTISYERKELKSVEASKVNLNKFYFDGYHDGKTSGIKYQLEYGNFDNRLKVVVEDNDFLNRVSAYYLTLESGSLKYEKVYSDFNTSDIESCGGKKCFIVDYADIASFKGKDIKVNLTAFYDTGYIGLEQKTIIGDYFEKLGLVDNKTSSKTGYVYQENSILAAGRYIYIKDNGSNVVFEYNTKPMGILSSIITNNGTSFKITTNNLVDIDKNKFVKYGEITNTTNNFFPILSGIYESNVKYLNLKVLDMVDIPTEDNTFKFTSITPKVSSKVKPLINGGVFNIDLSVDEETLKTDFIKTGDNYNFYIEIYKETLCDKEDEECTPTKEEVKTVTTTYDKLNEVTIIGLDPDTTYTYRILADMNKQGKKEITPLFDYNRAGYVEYKNTFKTLNKDNVLDTLKVTVSSEVGETTYSKRTLNINIGLKTNTNFDILYEIYDINDELKYSRTISNTDFNISSRGVITAKYLEDISGKDFVFGSDYYTLKIYAVTTDLNRKLELYNDKIKQVASSIYIDVPELSNPVISIDNQEALVAATASGYEHSIKYKISVKDPHRVIIDGKYTVELQNSANKNICTNPNDCIVEVDIKNNTCNFKNGKTCTILSNGNNGQVIEVVFEKLKPNTNYVVYALANTYRNNVSLKEEEKTSKVDVRKSQYTKSDLGFSLGNVTPTAIAKNKMVVTFVGASNIANYIKGIEYSVAIQNGDIITSGTIGTTADTKEDIVFTLDSDNFPYLTINLPDEKEFGENNVINITYYYLDSEGKVSILKLNNETVFDYNFKYNK